MQKKLASRITLLNTKGKLIVIDALLAKYADQGITAIDDIGDLTVSPFDDFGTPYEIVNDIFGGREQYLFAVHQIQQALYA